MTKKIVALAGDGIGPEIMEAGLSVLKAVAEKTNFDYSVQAHPFGGAGIDAAGHPLPASTLEASKGILSCTPHANLKLKIYQQ